MANLKNTVVNDTGFFRLPVGTTAQRVTPTRGDLRFNSSTNLMEHYNGSRWSSQDISEFVGMTSVYPADSARQILSLRPASPSGWYWIKWPGTADNVPVLTYCDMTGAEVSSTATGWMRVDDQWWNANSAVLFDRELAFNSTVSWFDMRWQDDGNNTGSRNLFCVPRNGIIRTLKIRVPSGSRGVRVRRMFLESVAAPDGGTFNDQAATNPSNVEIISAANGNVVNKGSNFASFGLYFGNGLGQGRRLYNRAFGSFHPNNTGTRFNNLTQTTFNQFDDIGSDADRLIWYETESAGEYDNIYKFDFWIR
jgi:hypothetical protein